MAYSKTTWEDGMLITAELLNKIEKGIEDKQEKGDTGPSGKNGSCFRLSATALSDNKADIAATALAPTNAEIPYAVGDIVIDGTTKKLYKITNVSGGVATIGTALCTLP